MSRVFYGVYLEEQRVSVALDLIRFLAEPKSIRYSHITIRGPYSRKLPATKLASLNSSPEIDWRVSLIEPVGFISNVQATVAISVDLGSLSSLVYKPDFPHGVPHITVYDGHEKWFALALLESLRKWKRWQYSVAVSRLRQISPKRRVDQEFLPFFGPFSAMFAHVTGNIDRMRTLREASATERLALIDCVLSGTSPDLDSAENQDRRKVRA